MVNTTDEPPQPQLFTGMTFYIRPCSIRRFIHILVKKHGGEFSRSRTPTTIVLTEVLEHSTGYHTDFIHDSIKNKKLQPQDKYKLPGYSSGISVDSNLIKMPANLLNKARQRYSPAEDDAIAQYIAKYASSKDKVGSVNGNVIWKDMERKKVTVHSWQSMKDRYINHIQHCPPKFKYAALDVCGGGAVASSDGKRVVMVESEPAVEQDMDTKCEKTPIGNGTSCPVPAPVISVSIATGNTNSSLVNTLTCPDNTATIGNKDNTNPKFSACVATSPDTDGDETTNTNDHLRMNTSACPDTASTAGDNKAASNINCSRSNNSLQSVPVVSVSAPGKKRTTKKNDESSRATSDPTDVHHSATKGIGSSGQNGLPYPVPSSVHGDSDTTRHTDNGRVLEAQATSADSLITVSSANLAPSSTTKATKNVGIVTYSNANTPIVTSEAVDAAPYSLLQKCGADVPVEKKTIAISGGESTKMITGTAGSVERMKNSTEDNTSMTFGLAQSSNVDFISEPVYGPTGPALLSDNQSDQIHEHVAPVDLSPDQMQMSDFKQKDNATLFTESEDEDDEGADDDDLDKTLLKEAIKVATGDEDVLNEVSFTEDWSSQTDDCECYEQVDCSRALKLKEHIESIPGNDPAWVSVRNELIMRDVGLKYGLSVPEVKEILLTSRT